jgi:hypothetical protein
VEGCDGQLRAHAFLLGAGTWEVDEAGISSCGDVLGPVGGVAKEVGFLMVGFEMLGGVGRCGEVLAAWQPGRGWSASFVSWLRRPAQRYQNCCFELLHDPKPQARYHFASGS